MTYEKALGLAAVTVPDHLEAQAEVPVLTGPQAQGDLLIVPATGRSLTDAASVTVPTAGVQVVRGEATGNTHWLHQGLGAHGVTWTPVDVGQVVGLLEVPAGESALLIHTDEHGANGVGPGRYEVRRQREQAEQVRQVAD